MMCRVRFSARGALWAFLLHGVVGCAQSEPVDDRLRAMDPAALVPAGGVVTVNGKPVEMLVITFLPPSGPALGTAETDKDGKYELASMGGPGVLPGEYKVAISYVVSDKGEPQGMAARGSRPQVPGMKNAKEKLPPEYADLGRSKLSATVGSKGGTFNFDVAAPEFGSSGKPAEKKVEAKLAGTTKGEEPKPTDKNTIEPKATQKQE
jgi:hypothetical protein